MVCTIVVCTKQLLMSSQNEDSSSCVYALIQLSGLLSRNCNNPCLLVTYTHTNSRSHFAILSDGSDIGVFIISDSIWLPALLVS